MARSVLDGRSVLLPRMSRSCPPVAIVGTQARKMALFSLVPLLSFVVIAFGGLRLLVRWQRRHRDRAASSLLVVPPQG